MLNVTYRWTENLERCKDLNELEYIYREFIRRDFESLAEREVDMITDVYQDFVVNFRGEGKDFYRALKPDWYDRDKVKEYLSKRECEITFEELKWLIGQDSAYEYYIDAVSKGAEFAKNFEDNPFVTEYTDHKTYDCDVYCLDVFSVYDLAKGQITKYKAFINC